VTGPATTRGLARPATARRAARRAILLTGLVAALVLAFVGGINFTVDSAGVLRDRSTTKSVQNYIEALRVAKVGLPYTHYDRPIRLALAATSKADCLVTGSSHTMSLRRESNAIFGAECGALDNSGVTGAGFEDRILIMGAALANSKIKHIYIGFDLWSFKRDISGRWRRTTAAFLSARTALGLPDGIYAARGGETPEEVLRELFSFSYLRLNYKAMKKSVSDDDELSLDAVQPLEEHELRNQLALRPDGSLSSPEEFKPTPGDADLAVTDQWIEPPYYEPEVLAEMRQAITRLQGAGKAISFIIEPYHPIVFRCGVPRICEGMKIVDPVIRNLAAELNVPVIGGFNPSNFGLIGDDFVDFQHLRGSAAYHLRILRPAEAAADHLLHITN
jgi:hypothetical protein